MLGQYDEPTASWLYTKALAFLREGDSPDARRCLLDALEHNRHVPAYILGEKKLPKEIPEQVGFGDKSEAVVYTAEFGISHTPIHSDQPLATSTVQRVLR